MPTPARPRLRRTRRLLGYGALVALILFATLVGIANRLLPLVEEHPDRIAAWLTQRVGQPVAFTRAHAEWTRRGPLFILDGLRVGGPADVLEIGRAQLQVAMYSGLLPGRPLTELKIKDLALRLEQGADHRWRLVGLPGQQRPDPLEMLEGFGELQIEKARLAVRAPRYKLDLVLPRVDLRIRVGKDRLLAGASIWADASSAPMRVAADLGRRDYQGTLWVGGEQLELVHWSPLLAATGVRVRAGGAQLGVWAQVNGGRVDQVTFEAVLGEVALASADSLPRADGTARPVTAGFERLEATARWTMRSDHWVLQVPRLRFRRDGTDAQLDGLRLDGGNVTRLGAKRLDLAPLAQLLALSPRVPSALRAWLDASRPRALLHDVALQRDKGGGLSGQVRLSDLALEPVGTRPGISGLGAALRFDGVGGIARLGSTPVRIDWPAGFGAPVDARLDGSLGWWRDDSGWKVGSSALRVGGEGFSADVRLGLELQSGSLPRLDLAADLGPTDFATAKKFWIRHKMPPATIRWLDRALVEGRIELARVVFAGDLDDWPFRHKEGVFDARAKIRDATLRFSPDWPAAGNLDLDVAFDGPGFSVVGTGELGGNQVTRLEGGIADFHVPRLVLAIDADGRAEKLRTLMLASPLQKAYGTHLRALTATGDAQVKLALELPLGTAAGTRRIEGDLHLRDASLADSRWDVAFDHVNGVTRFTNDGFSAEALEVRFEQQPAVFDLKIGAPYTGDARLAGLANLRAKLPAGVLVKRYPALDWVEPYLQGNSEWDVQVRIPAAVPGRTGPPAQLRVLTDLRGTRLALPAPLAKPGDTAMSLELIAPLPVEQGEVSLRLGAILHLRAQMSKQAPMRAALQFGGAAPAPPAQGMVVRGSVAKLDAAGWIAFSAGGEGNSPLREVDVQAHELLLFDRGFADTHVRLQRSTG
ncbi:MAG: YhdP family protein, partial [Arenimonas sp.]